MAARDHERAAAIGEAIAASNMPQNDIAWKLGVSPGTLSRWANGKSSPQLRHWSAIRDLLDVDLALIGRSMSTEDELAELRRQVTALARAVRELMSLAGLDAAAWLHEPDEEESRHRSHGSP